MKFYFNQLIYFWRITGFVGKDADWFIGYSSRPKVVPQEQLDDHLLKTGITMNTDGKLEEDIS